MKRFRIFFFALVFALPLTLTAEVSAEDAAAVPSQKTETSDSARSVVKGDTLWQITKAAYGDPFLWPMLWESNKTTVANPHLIYPGQILSLPSSEDLKKMKLSAASPAASATAKPSSAPVAKKDERISDAVESDETAESQPAAVAAPSAESVPVEEVSSASAREAVAPVEESAPVAVAPPPAKSPFDTSVVKGQPRRDARVVDSSFFPDGVISGIMDGRLLVSQGDIVYVNFTFVKPEVGKRLGIYRKIGSVRNPADGRNLGEEIVRMGTLQIIEISDTGTASSRIVSSRDSVQINDWVLVEK